jgi:hypothetical protein
LAARTATAAHSHACQRASADALLACPAPVVRPA